MPFQTRYSRKRKRPEANEQSGQGEGHSDDDKLAPDPKVPRTIGPAPHQDLLVVASTSHQAPPAIPLVVAVATPNPPIQPASVKVRPPPDLPMEIFLRIFEFAPVHVLLVLDRVCKKFHEAMDDMFLIKDVMIRRAGMSTKRAARNPKGYGKKEQVVFLARDMCGNCDKIARGWNQLLWDTMPGPDGGRVQICWDCRSNDMKFRRIGKSKAKELYHLTGADLEHTPYILRHLPQHPAVSGKLFRLMDVESIAETKNTELFASIGVRVADIKKLDEKAEDVMKRRVAARLREIRKERLEARLVEKGLLVDTDPASSLMVLGWGKGKYKQYLDGVFGSRADGERLALEDLVAGAVKCHALLHHTNFQGMLESAYSGALKDRANANGGVRDAEDWEVCWRVCLERWEILERKALKQLSKLEGMRYDFDVACAEVCSCGRKELKHVLSRRRT